MAKKLRRAGRRRPVDTEALRRKAREDRARFLEREGARVFARAYPEVAADRLLMAKAKGIIRHECEIEVYGIVRRA